MKDIKRVYMYHGAEHKCINCIEHGLELNVENVRKSSKQHKRCGTSFLFFVMFISVIFFVFINVSNPIWQVGIRLLLVPVIAGISYEVIRWAGRSETPFVKIISVPGMWLQALTTREPDDDMIEVAIKAVEEVFDWKKFLAEYEDENKDENKDDNKDDNKVSDVNENTDNHDAEYAVTKEPKQEENIEKPVDVVEPVEPVEPVESVEQDEEDDEEDEDDMSGFEMIGGLDDDIDSDEDDTDLDSVEVEESVEDEDEDLDQDSDQDSDEDSDEDDEDEDSDEDGNDDGISFINDDEDDDSTCEEIPIFKQRKTDL